MWWHQPELPAPSSLGGPAGLEGQLSLTAGPPLTWTCLVNPDAQWGVGGHLEREHAMDMGEGPVLSLALRARLLSLRWWQADPKGICFATWGPGLPKWQGIQQSDSRANPAPVWTPSFFSSTPWYHKIHSWKLSFYPQIIAGSTSWSLHFTIYVYMYHTHTHIHMHIYIFLCVFIYLYIYHLCVFFLIEDLCQTGDSYFVDQLLPSLQDNVQCIYLRIKIGR